MLSGESGFEKNFLSKSGLKEIDMNQFWKKLI